MQHRHPNLTRQEIPVDYSGYGSPGPRLCFPACYELPTPPLSPPPTLHRLSIFLYRVASVVIAGLQSRLRASVLHGVLRRGLFLLHSVYRTHLHLLLPKKGYHSQ